MMHNQEPMGDEMDTGEDSGSEDSESSELPLSILGDAKEGDEVKVRVVSVDQESGTATVTKCASEAAPQGSDTLAADYNKQPEGT